MRRQLVLLVTAVTSLVLVAFLVPLALLLRTIAEDRAVSMALQEAQGLAPVAAVVTDPVDLEAVVVLADQSSPRALSVVLPDGRAIGSALTEGSRALALASEGQSLTVQVEDGREVLVPVRTTAGTVVVRSLVPDDQLHEGVLAATLLLVALGGGLLLVAVLVADRLALGTVRPVTDLARTAHRLSEGDLSARTEARGPQEVRDVAAAVNVLGHRIGELLAAERETVADLSHRLRTPLTALRLEAEGLRDSAESDRVEVAVTGVERVVDDVIRAARRPVREGVRVLCDARGVAEDRVGFWRVLAEDQGRELHLVLPTGPAPVRLLVEDLAAAVDALLENALSHTPEGTRLDVAVSRSEDEVQVEVSDRGPGLTADAAVRGHSGAGSTGLGLDIARRTAEAAGGRLVLADRPSGGACITLVMPLATNP